jgi:hypothetical protein
MIEKEDRAALALARRLMLDVRQLIQTRGGEAAAILLLRRRLKLADDDEVQRAIEAGVRVGLLAVVRDNYLALGEQAKALFARRKTMLNTYPPEQRTKPPTRFDKVIRSRRRGVRTEFKRFRERGAALKAWRNANPTA